MNKNVSQAQPLAASNLTIIPVNTDEPKMIAKPNQLPEWATQKRKWSVYRHHDLKQRCHELGSGNHLIEGLLPERALGLVVGNSGIGKSPYLYQAALCVAAGMPFLGHPVRQGRVLYLDFENGLGEVDEIINSLLDHLSLAQAPDNLRLWNLSDSPPNWEQSCLAEMVHDVQPALVIVDSITALFPDIEDKNSNATKHYQSLRKIIRENSCSMFGVHHLRKPPKDFTPESLETGQIIRWFHQARGAGALINNCDVRIGMEPPTSYLEDAGEEAILATRGFWRVHGEIPLTYLARSYDDESGEPLGYSQVSGSSLLFNKDQEAAFAKLPDFFRFKEAKKNYSKGAQATTDFLKKCISCGILRKVKGGYRKVVE